MRRRTTGTEIDKVIARIEPDKFGCLIWPGPLKRGYPFKGEIKITRFLLERQIERPLVGYALHGCDNPSCVNLAHLYEGTDHDNAKDKWARNYDYRYRQLSLKRHNYE
jgi:hypothetical protein